MTVMCSFFHYTVMAIARVLVQFALWWDFPYIASVSCFVACHARDKPDVASEMWRSRTCFS
jgi:hypothetical protein